MASNAARKAHPKVRPAQTHEPEAHFDDETDAFYALAVIASHDVTTFVRAGDRAGAQRAVTAIREHAGAARMVAVRAATSARAWQERGDKVRAAADEASATHADITARGIATLARNATLIVRHGYERGLREIDKENARETLEVAKTAYLRGILTQAQYAEHEAAARRILQGAA